MKPKKIIALATFAGIVVLSGCGQNEIAALKTERDSLQAKSAATEKEAAKLTGDIKQVQSELKQLESELAKASNGFQLALVGASNSFGLERAGMLLTNRFLAGQLEQLKSDLDAQHRRLLADQNRENEEKKLAPIKDGLRALRKLDAAANIGTSIGDYNRLLIESQGPIREAVEASGPETKVLLIKADKAFQDAQTLWSFCNEFSASIPRSSRELMDYSDNAYVFNEYNPEISRLILDYEIPKKSNSGSKGVTIRRSVALTVIWGVAKNNLQQAEKLFAAQAEKGAGSK